MSKRSSIDLSQFDDGFRGEQPEERGEFESVPDGKYQVTVEKGEMAEAQSTGNPMLKWTLRVIAPKFVNRLMWRNSVITHNTLKYVKTDLHLCGLDLDKLSDLPKHLKKLLDVKLEVTWFRQQPWKDFRVMARVCDICGKGPQFGNTISHAHNVSKRRWNVNLRPVHAKVGAATKHIRVCTSCLRSGKVVKA